MLSELFDAIVIFKCANESLFFDILFIKSSLMITLNFIALLLFYFIVYTWISCNFILRISYSENCEEQL